MYASSRQQGVTDELVTAVRQEPQGPLFDDREKAALRLADILAGDHKKASDELFDDLREHFTESEIVTLGWRISIFVGYGRFLATLDMDTVGDACPLPELPASGVGDRASPAKGAR